MSQRELEEFAASNEDIYICNDTFDCAMLSAGCAIEAMNAVLDNRYQTTFLEKLLTLETTIFFNTVTRSSHLVCKSFRTVFNVLFTLNLTCFSVCVL